MEQLKSYSCTRWRDGCKFTIWKKIAGKTISAATAKALLGQGKTRLLKGFKSRAGKRFEARLKLDGTDVKFDFQASS